MEKPKTEVPPAASPVKPESASAPRKEIGGSKKPEPTRYGDWEINGKCVDF